MTIRELIYLLSNMSEHMQTETILATKSITGEAYIVTQINLVENLNLETRTQSKLLVVS